MDNKDSNQNFTELKVWQEARSLKKAVYLLVSNFPPEEKYSLRDQLVRSARSVCSNISEGHGRFTFKDQIHFCVQARGSLSETLNHLLDAADCKYITQEMLSELQEKHKTVEKLLNGYISYLRKNITQ